MQNTISESEDLIIDKEWLKLNKDFYFFGPCSAESPEQLHKTATLIAKDHPNAIFRAGVWKPRTRPSSFQGIGEPALEWLKEIKEEYNLRIATEVASPLHIEKSLKAGIDILWIGARTTVNPFTVQDIADALKGVDIPIFVKNPINPDLSLWMGALERINKAGIKRLGAIHRGFHLSDNGPYRNYPYWNLAIQLKATYANLPLICDASHIGGNTALIPQLAQKAYDLDMDGLMIETHYKPSVALSDKEQQLKPKELTHLLNTLVRKKRSSTNPTFQNQLEELRSRIDKIDDNLVDLLAVRMDIAKRIGLYKKQNNVTILQLERWNEILRRVLKNGEALDLSTRFVQALFSVIHDESIRKQTAIKEEEGKN